MRNFIDIVSASPFPILIENTVLTEDEGEPMPHPMVLYRSVSIPELVSIAFRNEVTGGGNKFSGDNRQWVFFGDELNRNLILQGEDHSRYPGHALKDDPIHRDFKTNTQDVEELGWLAANTLQHAAKQKGWTAVDQTLLDRIETGSESVVRKARSDYARYDAQLKKTLDDLVAAIDARRALQDRYQGLHRDAARAFHAVRQQWAVTSAVIVTRPIDGGTMFTDETGSNHDGNEYGFYRGEVTGDDIATVILYNHGEEVTRAKLDEVLPLLKQHGIDTTPYLA